LDHFYQLLQDFRIEGIVNPSALWTIRDQSRILEHFQMKGQARLPRLKGIGEVAHTLLTLFEALHDFQPCFV
jgi:hypothetical protein